MNKNSLFIILQILSLLLGGIIGYTHHEIKEQKEIRVQAQMIFDEWNNERMNITANDNLYICEGDINDSDNKDSNTKQTEKTE